MLESNIPDNDLKQVGELDDPVFYPNGSLDRQVFPWKDAISHVVKFSMAGSTPLADRGICGTRLQKCA